MQSYDVRLPNIWGRRFLAVLPASAIKPAPPWHPQMDPWVQRLLAMSPPAPTALSVVPRDP